MKECRRSHSDRRHGDKTNLENFLCSLESARVVTKLAQNSSKFRASVVHSPVAVGPGYHHFARLEHQRSCLGLSLVYQPDDLQWVEFSGSMGCALR